MSDTAQHVVKVLAGLASAGLILSPSVAIRRIHQTKSVGVTSVFPFVALLANSFVWSLYGYMNRNFYPIFGTFTGGVVFATCYLVIYWHYTHDRRAMLKVVLPVLLFLLVVLCYVLLGGFGATGQTRKQVGSALGYVGDVVSMCLFGAPLERVFHVLKHKSAAFIQLPMVLAGFVTNALWFTYGVLSHNWFLIVPNMVFLVVGSANILLYVVYNPATHPLQPSHELPAKERSPRASTQQDYMRMSDWPDETPV